MPFAACPVSEYKALMLPAASSSTDVSVLVSRAVAAASQ